MKALSRLGSAFEYLMVLFRLGVCRIVGTRFFGQLEMGFYDVINVFQNHRGSLLAVLLNEQPEWSFKISHCLLDASEWDFARHFIAADIGELYRISTWMRSFDTLPRVSSRPLPGFHERPRGK
jgi:hypothetical protein